MDGVVCSLSLSISLSLLSLDAAAFPRGFWTAFFVLCTFDGEVKFGVVTVLVLMVVVVVVVLGALSLSHV